MIASLTPKVDVTEVGINDLDLTAEAPEVRVVQPLTQEPLIRTSPRQRLVLLHRVVPSGSPTPRGAGRLCTSHRPSRRKRVSGGRDNDVPYRGSAHLEADVPHPAGRAMADQTPTALPSAMAPGVSAKLQP